MNKSFWIPLSAAFGTIILLYIIGFIASIEAFVFKVSLSGDAEIALLPIIVGGIVGFISERIIKLKAQ